MSIKGHRIIIVVGLLLLVGVLAVFGRNAPTATASSSLAIQNVALIGSMADIDATIPPLVGSGQLRHLRDYHAPLDYLDEAPAPFFVKGSEPTDLIIRLYQLTVPPADVSQTKSDVQQAIFPVSPTVKLSFDELQFLTFVPKQIVVHGDCTAMDDLETTFTSISPLASLELFYSPANPTPCINLYHVNSGMVDTVIDDINATVSAPAPPSYPVYWAERNYLASGAMGGVAAFGSGGYIAPDAPAPTPLASPLSTTGDNVKILVFDTSPYSFTTPEYITEVANSQIEVRHDYPLPTFLPERNALFPAMDAHGTLVTSRILELAPGSSIRLQRVLDQHAIGTSFLLYKAIHDGIQTAISAVNGDASGVIFNYSLSIDAEINLERTSLYRLLGEVNQQNIVQVAASGNNSAHAAVPQPMTLPAAHPTVIGVASLANSGMLACYSNVGNVAVPGGGAAIGAMHCNMDEMVEACKHGAHSDCAIGWDPDSSTLWAWSVGSSFAAPVVTGFVAQIIELIASRPRSTAPQNFVDYEAVWAELQNYTSGGSEETGAGTLFAPPTSAVTGLQGRASAENLSIALLVMPMILLTLSILPLILRRRR